MTRVQIIFLVIGTVLAGAVAESYLGSARYQLNGAAYAVPHKYEFGRSFSLPWLQNAKGLDEEPGESVWLLFPADELARHMPGYQRLFHGYSSEVPADIVVNVLGGREAREFPGDRLESVNKVAQELAGGGVRRADHIAGWDRVYLAGYGPEEGGRQFYLIPHEGLERLPSDSLVPSCLASSDVGGRETYDCRFATHRGDLTYDFHLRQENLGVANRIPGYLLFRLEAWRR